MAPSLSTSLGRPPSLTSLGPDDAQEDYHRDKTVDNVRLTLRAKTISGDHAVALTVSTGRWEIQAASMPFPNHRAHPGMALLNVASPRCTQCPVSPWDSSAHSTQCPLTATGTACARHRRSRSRRPTTSTPTRSRLMDSSASLGTATSWASTVRS